MDKRTLLFVLLVGVTFFGFNLYFSYERDQKNREQLKQREAQKAKESVVIQEQVTKRKALLTSLPLIEITATESGKEVIGQGISVEGNTLTLAWEDSLPKTIYVKGTPQTLRTEDYVVQGPVVYAPADFKQLDIAALPEEGLFDVQVVIFPEKDSPQVFLGEYKDGTLIFPGDRPKSNGIALYQTQSGYLPLGFYEWRGDLFVELQNLPLLQTVVKTQPTALKKREGGTQKYYVLENAYQQLVFTNVGGALAEVNLPFHTAEDPASVVNEIGFDRQIAKESPSNAHFPAHPYYTPDSSEEKSPGPVGGYYPLLRRGISNQKTVNIAPQYYALNLVSEYPEMAELTYEVKEFTPEKIVFEAMQPHRKITKTYTLREGKSGAPYSLDLTLKIEGDSRGLWLTSGVPEVEIMSNRSSPQIQYRLSRKGKADVEKLDLPKPKEMITSSSSLPDWVVNSNGYLGLILDPLSEVGAGFRATAIPGTLVPTRLSVIDPQYHPYPASKYPGYQVLLPIPTRGGTLNFRVYAGPFEESTLKAVDKIFSDPSTGYNPDYIACRTFYGWFSFISKPFAKLLFIVMKFFHSITNSWGFSIILLTVFLRLLLYPLNAWSIKSMRRMQEISPQVKAIQKRHKKDPKKAQMEIMALYRERKINPFTGCIPILIQLPFLIAMFDLLKSSFQLRGASFIPGWIDNLTAPDVLFSWKKPLFFIGNQFHLLPILLGAVMFLQQRMSSGLGKKVEELTDQQRQQRSMGSIMTVVFTVMFYHFPSGLNLYWLSSMLLGIGQQWLTNKVLDKKKHVVPVIEVPKKR